MKIVADADIPFVERCFESVGQVQLFQAGKLDSKLLADADILLVRSTTKVNADLLANTKIRFVGTSTIGLEHIDIDYLTEHNIGFASAPGSNSNSVAEYVIAAILVLAKKYGFDLMGKSIGIIGAGNIGSRLAEMVQTLGMKVFLNDPPLQRQTGDEKYRPLKELFDCDFITLHTPLTFESADRTLHFADQNFFDSLKPGVFFINTARGAVTDTVAVKAAIKSKIIKAAVIDVWENEPDIDKELVRLADLATSHIAGYSFDGKSAGMIMIYKAVCKYFGLKEKYKTFDLLPPAPLAEIKADISLANEQKILSSLVNNVYDIQKDDSDLRRILKVESQDRADFFKQLRSNYPIRREFYNIHVILQSRCDSLSNKLKGIGFKVDYEKDN